ALGLVFFVGGADLIADRFPLLVAEPREGGEISRAAKMSCTVDRDRLTRQIFATIRHHEHGKIGELIHFSVTSHWNAVGRIAAAARQGLRIEAFPRALCWEGSGSNRVETNSMRTPFGRERLRHDVQASLRHRGGDRERTAIPDPCREDRYH